MKFSIYKRIKKFVHFPPSNLVKLFCIESTLFYQFIILFFQTTVSSSSDRFQFICSEHTIKERNNHILHLGWSDAFAMQLFCTRGKGSFAGATVWCNQSETCDHITASSRFPIPCQSLPIDGNKIVKGR